jgi:hypothetical protein
MPKYTNNRVGLWKKDVKGNTVLGGKIGDQFINVWRNEKQQGKQPNFHLVAPKGFEFALVAIEGEEGAPVASAPAKKDDDFAF